jgi:hypothetical protein
MVLLFFIKTNEVILPDLSGTVRAIHCSGADWMLIDLRLPINSFYFASLV